VIHESGHGLYEMGVDDALQHGPLANGASMGMHESQSRLYENMIGRSRAFQPQLLPILRDIYPDAFGKVTEDALYRAVNQVVPGLIRTEADELTYSMHIMIRFELERALFDGSLKVQDLPAAWNERYKSYLGLTVPNDAQGVLQDIHWSGGAFGYFPSYSIGSAYAAQIYAAMARDIDVAGSIAAGDIGRINTWLGDKIHRHGMMYPPAQLLEMACGQPFDATYYTDYLKNKYTALYGL
jgi:carboxypeptidase Taq